MTPGTDCSPDHLGGGAANWGGRIYEVIGLIVLNLYYDSIPHPPAKRR